jgi:hypothetical protein
MSSRAACRLVKKRLIAYLDTMSAMQRPMKMIQAVVVEGT